MKKEDERIRLNRNDNIRKIKRRINKRIALFDVDETIFPYDVGALFLRYLRKKDILKDNLKNKIIVIYYYLLHKLGLLKTKDIEKKKFDIIKNIEKRDLEKLIRSFIRENKIKAFSFIVEEMKRLKKRGLLLLQ